MQFVMAQHTQSHFVVRFECVDATKNSSHPRGANKHALVDWLVDRRVCSLEVLF